MPLYDTQCSTCSRRETRKLSFQQYEALSSGSLTLECGCGGKSELVFDPSAVCFVLKDGESGGWATKAQKENRYRSARRDVMVRRERDHVQPNRLVPNYGGQVAGSWAEAKDAAYHSTYERVNREHGPTTAAKAATETAKTYNAHVKREAP